MSIIKQIREEMGTSWQHAKLVHQSIEMMKGLQEEEDINLSIHVVLHTLLAERCGLSPSDFTKTINTWGGEI